MHDGASPETYERLRPRLVETLAGVDAEVGLHGSYGAADDEQRLAGEKATLDHLGVRPEGLRYHYLRIDPHRNLRPLAALGFAYDTSLAFSDAVGFRAGLARPFRPWDFDREEPLDLVEIPLAVMDVTLAERRYLGLSARGAWPRLEAEIVDGTHATEIHRKTADRKVRLLAVLENKRAMAIGCSGASGSAGGTRRRTARMRAITSGPLNGLTT